jgi:hypothetical protein
LNFSGGGDDVGGGGGCNETRYYCENSSYEFVGGVIENQYQIIVNGYESLVGNRDEAEDGLVFLFYPNVSSPLLIYNLSGN